MEEFRKFSRGETYQYLYDNRVAISADSEKYGKKRASVLWKITEYNVNEALFFAGKKDKVTPSTLKQLEKNHYEVLEGRSGEEKAEQEKSTNGKAKFKCIIHESSFEDYDIWVFEKDGKEEYAVPKSKIEDRNGQMCSQTGTNSIHWGNFGKLADKLSKDEKQFKALAVKGINRAIRDYLDGKLLLE